MKTTEFIVEYAGIGEDAEAMSADHEVQLARQQCYHAARDAIALHHILKDVSEQEGLESWVSEKLTQAASNLKDVIEHLEEMRNGGEGEEMDIMHAFSMESAEAKYAEMLGETRLDELNAERYADYEYAQQDQPRQQVAAPVSSRMFAIVDRASGRKLKSFAVRSEAERAAARMGGFSKVKVIGEEEVENDADPITELDSSTMQAYLQKRKETPTPRTLHKAGVQAKGVRSAHEKIHDKLVMKHAIAGGDTRVREGEVTKTPTGLKHKATDKYGAQEQQGLNKNPERLDKTATGRLDKSIRQDAEIDEAFKEVPTHGKTGKPNPNHPNFAKHDADFKSQQKAMRPPAQPKLTLNDVWRQVEHVVGQIFPDGDPIDWMAPWLEKRGYHDWDIGKIIDRAAKANGYKDMYDYWDQLKQQMDADNAYDAQMGEAGGAPRVKKPQMFRIDVPQGIRQPAAQAIKKLGMEIDGQGYTEGSTSWSFAVYNRKFASAEQCTEALRKAMGGYNEYMRVADFVYQESKEQVDEISRKTVGAYKKAATADLEKVQAKHDADSKDGWHYQDSYDERNAWAHMHKRKQGLKRANGEKTNEEQVDELSSATLKSYVPKANRSREKATDDMMNKGGYDPKVDDKMGRRAEFTMKANNKINNPEKVTELSKNTLGSYAKKANDQRAHEPDDMKADRRGTGVMKALDKIAGGTNKGNKLKGDAAQARFTNANNMPNAAHDRENFNRAVDRRVAKEDVNEASDRFTKRTYPISQLSKVRAHLRDNPTDGNEYAVGGIPHFRIKDSAHKSFAAKTPVKEDATGGASSVGGIAAGVAGARAGKPGTGKPKDLGNKVSRKQVQVGKGVY